MRPIFDAACFSEKTAGGFCGFPRPAHGRGVDHVDLRVQHSLSDRFRLKPASFGQTILFVIRVPVSDQVKEHLAHLAAMIFAYYSASFPLRQMRWPVPEKHPWVMCCMMHGKEVISDAWQRGNFLHGKEVISSLYFFFFYVKMLFKR
jgi:hypothetical protein